MSPIVDGGTATGIPSPSPGIGTTDIEQIFIVVNQQLQDTLASAFPYTTLIPYLNLAFKEIINLKPEAYPVTKNLDLVAGAIQDLGTQGIEILDVVCNMGTGNTVGTAISHVQKVQMDLLLPDWMTHPTSDTVQFIVLDARTPKTFYTFPPMADTTKKIKAVVSDIPTEITAVGDTYPLDHSYDPAVIDYVVGRCLLEETTIPNALNKGQMFMQKFMQDLGLKTNQEKATEQKGK